ncbi:peptidoglycan DD-metalloendopeptidase family protein [Syntrophomonas curvata]
MKRKKKQSNPHVTFMLIPHNAARPLQWKLSRKAFPGLAIGVALFVMGFAAISFLFYSSQEDIRHVNRIKQDSQEKQKTIELLKQEIEKIEEQQDAIAKKQNQLKRIMGIKSENAPVPEPSRGGKGGIDRQIQSFGDAGVLQQAEELRTQLARQEKELDELLAQANDNTEYFRHLPNQWPVQGDITSDFGWRKSPFGGRGSTFHDGIDIANDSGTPVVAAADGTVTFAGWKGAYGRLVEIDHSYGYVTKYGHNSALLVDVGDKVKKGEEIARVGNTGRSTGPHLHFMVVKDDEAYDPLVYLP